MELIGFFAVWLWLLAVCCALAALTTDKTAAVLPLVVLCGALVLLCGAGCLGLLRVGTLALLGAGFAGCAAVWALRGRAFWRHAVRQLTCPAWLLAFGGSALLALLLAWRQPLFSGWDEFSFWGSAARVTWQWDTLYTLAQGGNLAARTYPPALPVLGYLFAALSPRFAPWLLYAAYGVLTCAVLGAAVSLAGDDRRAAALGALLCLLLPFAAESWADGQTLTAYATAYADQMLGVLCAGACVLWYALADAGLPLRLTAVGCAVAALGLVKDVGLPLGLVAALVAAADCLADRGAPVLGKKHGAGATLPRRFVTAAAVFAALCAVAAAAYLGWAAHLADALETDRSQAGGSAGLSTAGMLLAGVKELLGIGRSEKFTAVLRAMAGAFLTRRASVFGSGLTTVAAVYALLAAAALAGRQTGRHSAGRLFAFGAASTAGFVGYTFFQLLCYVYVFSDTEGRGLASYPRYMGTWYLFWLVCAAALLLGQMTVEKTTDSNIQKEKYIRATKNAILLLATALVTGLCALHISVRDTLPGRTQGDDALQREIEARAAQVYDAVGGSMAGKADAAWAKEKVLLVSQWDDGGRWYRYAYALEPVALYHADGDNTIVPPGVEPGLPAQIILWLDAENIGAFLEQNGITLLLLDVDDYDFRLEFADLFADGMAGYDAGECFVYRVRQADGGVRFEPYTGQEGVAS